MLAFEQAYWRRRPGGVLAGVDEVGRGPLAGPVVACAVVIPQAAIAGLARGELAGLTDSKRLTAHRREAFDSLLRSWPGVRIGIGQADPGEIDRINILAATHVAMRRALLDLGGPLPDHALIDGLPAGGLPCPSTAIVQGDGRSLLIAGASVVAKVFRDRIMNRLDVDYPVYGWAANKGYGTRVHLLALRRYGATPLHRRSFQPVADVLQPGLFPPEPS
jgi:ribonuclease HII